MKRAASTRAALQRVTLPKMEVGPAGVDTEKRRHLRFDQMFAVALDSPMHGSMTCVARNISEGGMFLETRDPLPLGSAVRVHFAMPNGDGEIVANAEVKNHYFLNFNDSEGPRAISGMGVRFVSFEAGGNDCVQSLRRRVLH
jgi:hypothetical protein